MIIFKAVLKRIGVLEWLRKLKRRQFPAPKAFLPCTPHLLIAIQRSLSYLGERKLLEGADYLEFGLFRGFAFWYTQALCDASGVRDIRFFGFDSFLGLPKLDLIDQGGEFYEGAYECPRQDVEDYLNQYGVDWARTYLIDGWYDQTLNDVTQKKYSLRRCALCVIDCDLYESTRCVLDFLKPFIVAPMIILFDDWNSYDKADDKGERKAFKEFLMQNVALRAETLFDFGGHGQAFLISIH